MYLSRCSHLRSPFSTKDLLAIISLVRCRASSEWCRMLHSDYQSNNWTTSRESFCGWQGRICESAHGVRQVHLFPELTLCTRLHEESTEVVAKRIESKMLSTSTSHWYLSPRLSSKINQWQPMAVRGFDVGFYVSPECVQIWIYYLWIMWHPGMLSRIHWAQRWSGMLGEFCWFSP